MNGMSLVLCGVFVLVAMSLQGCLDDEWDNCPGPCGEYDQEDQTETHSQISKKSKADATTEYVCYDGAEVTGGVSRCKKASKSHIICDGQYECKQVAANTNTEAPAFEEMISRHINFKGIAALLNVQVALGLTLMTLMGALVLWLRHHRSSVEDLGTEDTELLAESID